MAFLSRRRVSRFATRRRKNRPSDFGRTFERLEDRLLLTSVTFTTPSSNGGDGTWTLQQREGTNVYVGPAYLYYNVNPAAIPGFQVGNPMYLKVNYYDEGSGRLRVEYDSVTDNFDDTEFHTRSSRINTLDFVSSYHYLENVQFANGGNGHDFRVNTQGVPVASVVLSDVPFPDSGLEWAWSPPWEAPYSGPSRAVDASTLAGKVIAGYQGWFNTPNDAADEGYVHWGQPGDWSIEQWPDANDYDPSELFPVPGVTTASGEQAYLFSSANASVVHRHFQWMREHDIDGVLVQRFRGSFMFKQGDGSYKGEPQWPVVNARDGAHREGRTWAIEYDIQNAGTEAQRWARIQEVKNDWEYLTDANGMDMLNDSHYQREDGKPVVAIFGLYVDASNSYSTPQQTDLVNWFKSRGVYVIGAGRHSQSAGQSANAGLHDAYIPWQGYWAGSNSFTPADNFLSGVTEHIPHVFPGFSWTHLKNSSTATSRDREDGDFYWRMLRDAVNQTDAPWLFIGMFDEYDEATNIIPASDDPPVPDNDAGGNPLTYQVSDPRPNDWWMALTGAAKQALQGKTTINGVIPTEAELSNRSNVGGEVHWSPAASDRLSVVETGDSQVETVMFTVDGDSFGAIVSTAPHLYFQVDDSFLSQSADGRDVTIEIEYLDSAVGQFRVEYGSPSETYMSSASAQLTGSGEWRTHRFEISDASFANNQNGDSDFRLEKAGGNLVVRRARVIKESFLTVGADLGATNTANGLQQVELVGDGQTVATASGGRDARMTTGAPTSVYMYVRVDDSFASQVRAGLNAIVEVVYQDVGSGSLNIQYDSTGSAFKLASPVSLTNSGAWRTARFYLDDALLGNRQNGASDFRITGSNIPIDQVRLLHSFGDLAAPELQVLSVAPSPSKSQATVAWSITDEWKTGSMDRWTQQQDNRVQVEWTNNGGSTWNPAGEVYEQDSPSAQSGYDNATGLAGWSDAYTWDAAGLAAGTYHLRLTPIDGRGNLGAPVESQEFLLDPGPELPGDYNTDGSVDAADYAVWRDALGAEVAPYSSADGDGDGSVGPEDYVVWKNHFGTTLPQAIVGDSSSISSLSQTTPAPLGLDNLAGPQPLAASGPAAVEGVYTLFIGDGDESTDPLPIYEMDQVFALEDDLLLLLAVDRSASESNEKPDSFDSSTPAPENSWELLESLEAAFGGL